MRHRLLCLCIILASTYGLAQTNPTPFLNQPLSPMSAAPGGSSFVLTIDGTNFVASSIVHWNSTALTTTFVNSSQLTAIVPATDIAHAGTASISVVNPAPGGGSSNLLTFDISNPVSSLNFSDFFDTTFQALDGNQVPQGAASVMTADFNGDGKIDLAEIVNNHALAIQLGNGDGSFQTPTINDVDALECDFSPSFVIADFNNDGKLDIAIPNCGASEISVLLGNGDGTFQSPSTYPATGTPTFIVAGDFNGDGKLDLATANRGSSNPISVFLGNGDGTFQNHVDYGSTGDPVGLVTGDFNGNGTLDLLFANQNNQVWLLSGNGDGTFSSPTQLTLPFSSGSPNFVTFNINSITAADVNEDHKFDLIVTSATEVQPPGPPNTNPVFEAFVTIFLGNGDGTFQSGTPIQIPNPTPPVGRTAPFPSAGTVIAADLNADGKLDLAVQNTGLAITLLLGNGDGTFQSGVNFATFLQDCGEGAFPFIGDFNGDGAIDLAATNNTCYLGFPNLTVMLQGNVPAALALPSALTFLDQPMGTTSPSQAVTISNSGTASLSISSLSLSGADAGDFAKTSTCGATLLPNASCTVNVTFTPLGSGTRNATLSFNNNGPGGLRTISLTGITASFLSPSSITFPNQYVGTSGLPQTVTLTNTDTINPLSITSVTASPGDFAVVSGCGSSVPAGSSCSIGVFFDPTTSGTRTGILTVTDSANGSPQTVSLSGVGQDFSLAPSSPSATVSAGQTAQYSVSLSPAGSFNQTVTLSCGGAPAQSSCSISPNSVQLNGISPTPVTVTVQTSGSSANLKYPSGTNLRLALWLATVGMPGFVLLGSGWKRRTRMKHNRGFYVLVILCLLTIPLAWSGCGGGSTSSGGNGSGGGGVTTPSGSYQLTVTGDFTSGSTNLVHTTQLTLVVK